MGDIGMNRVSLVVGADGGTLHVQKMGCNTGVILQLSLDKCIILWVWEEVYDNEI